ncbi:MAG: hypothetical protein ACTSV7_07955 [Candidatus Baldrarchaeia archaeon]|nr:hypothetical protein [Candidatus Baldrarchaeota archaeon]
MLVDSVPIILAIIYFILMVCSFSISSTLSGSKISKNYMLIAVACLVGMILSISMFLQQQFEFLGSMELWYSNLLYALSILFPLAIIALAFLNIAITYSKYT